MLWLFKKIHMYAGLFTFTALMVYGISGLMDSSLPAWSEREPPPTTERIVEFEAPPDLDDKEVADLIYAYMDMPLTGPPANYAVRRDTDQNLVVSFYTVNGVRTVTALESEQQLKVVTAEGGMVSFVTGMHGSRMTYASPRFLTIAWAVYNEAGLWALGFMALSGVVLWLATRPRYLWGRVAFIAGNAVFVTLYWLMR